MMKTLYFLLAVSLVAAAYISGLRMYKAGTTTAETKKGTVTEVANRSANYEILGISAKEGVGVATWILAENLVIIGTLVFRVFSHDKGRWFMAAPIAIGMAFALVGNYIIVRPGFGAWAWLDTIGPPIAVLSIALMGERILMPSLEARWANERGYQEALARYQQSVADPELLPGWRDTYAFALWEAWKRKQRKLAAEMSVEVRDAVVLREMQADRFFTDDSSSRSPDEQMKPAVIPRQRVIEYFQDHPEDRETDGNVLAVKLGVSPATVSRAKKAVSSNGHSGELSG